MASTAAARGAAPGFVHGADWSGIALTLLLPVLVASAFAYAALHPEEDGEEHRWVLALLLLIPFEFVRIVASWALGDAYRESRTALQAVRSYLTALAVLGVVILLISLTRVGLRETFSVLANPDTWRVIAPPAAIIAIDGCVALFFFRGNPLVQAARVEAQSDEAQDWFCLALCGFPFLVLLPGFFAYYQSTHGADLPEWLQGDTAFRAFGLLYGSVYFVGKGLLLSQVYGARFQRSGRRLLDAAWVRLFLLRGGDKRREAAGEEARKAGERRATFAEAAALPEPRAH